MNPPKESSTKNTKGTNESCFCSCFSCLSWTQFFFYGSDSSWDALSQETPKLQGGYRDVIHRVPMYSQPWFSPYGPFHTAQYAEYRHCGLRVDIVGCADEGGASFANDGLRKLKTLAAGLQTPPRFALSVYLLQDISVIFPFITVTV